MKFTSLFFPFFREVSRLLFSLHVFHLLRNLVKRIFLFKSIIDWYLWWKFPTTQLYKKISAKRFSIKTPFNECMMHIHFVLDRSSVDLSQSGMLFLSIFLLLIFNFNKVTRSILARNEFVRVNDVFKSISRRPMLLSPDINATWTL